MWHLVYTKAKQEFRAKINLENQKFSTFLPIIEYKNDQNIHLETMFPRYLFVQFDFNNDNWQKIKSTKGVSHLVSFNKGLAIVPEDIIIEIKSLLNAEDKLIVDEKKKNLKKGDKIIVLNGPLKGIRGTFVSMNSNERANVLLGILKKSVSTEMSSGDIDTLETGRKLKISLKDD